LLILTAAAALMVLALIPGFYAGDAARAASGGITVSTDKYVYHAEDSVVFNLTLDAGGASLSGDLVIKVYPATSLMNPDPFAAAPLSETTLEKNYSLSGPGTAQGTASLGDLKVGPGGYPFRISLMAGGNETLAGTGWLAVVDPAAHDPLDLVLLWTAGSPPLRDDRGRFTSTSLLERCQSNPPTADTLLQHADISQKFPGVKTTYAVEASLLDQLQDLADGFDLVQGDKTVNFSADSPEAKAAGSCLDGFRAMAAGGNSEFISTTYAFTDLPMLAKQGWGDGNGQYRLGHDVLGEALSLGATPTGAYAAGLDITTDSLRYLASTGSDYTVFQGSVRDSLQGSLPAGAPSYRIRDLSGERITGFFNNDDAAAALFSDTPDANAFFAALANSFTSGGSRLNIVASPSPSPVLSAEQRQRIYATIDQEPWLHTLSLSQARDKYRPTTQPVTLMKYVDPAADYLSQTYYQKLDATHSRFEDYRAAVDNDTSELMQLTREMFSAESIYFIGSGVSPDAANVGLAHLDAIDGFVAGEFSRLNISVSTPLLQRQSDGEATVTLTNNNGYAISADLTLSGDGVEFPEGSDQRLRIEPGSMKITVPFNSDGWSRIDARLASRGNTLVEDSAGIHLITSRGWIVILFALAALAAGTGYIFIVNRRR